MSAVTTNPTILGTGLIALDLVMGMDAETPVQSWAGGTCGNVMAIMAYLGWDAYPIGRMNGDPASERVRSDFQRWNVHLDFANCAPSGHTPIIIQQIRKGKDGSPTHRFLWSCPHCGKRLPSYRAVTQDAVEQIIPSLASSSVFFLDRVSRAALTLAAEASASGALVVFEPSGKSDEKLFAEAMKLAHIVKYADQRLSDAGYAMDSSSVTMVEIQTLGANGLQYRHRLGGLISEWSNVAAFRAPRLVDTCGSGDWCTSGILSKLAFGGQEGLLELGEAGLYDALVYGQALAAWNCGFEGARGGMYAISHSDFTEQVSALVEGRPALLVKERNPQTVPIVACPACPQNAEDTGKNPMRSAA